MTLKNVVVWIGGKRRFSKVVVVVSDATLTIFNQGREVIAYEIVEVVKDGMAYDVARGEERERFVAQAGCGCGGMSRYTPDDGYSGAL